MTPSKPDAAARAGAAAARAPTSPAAAAAASAQSASSPTRAPSRPARRRRASRPSPTPARPPRAAGARSDARLARRGAEGGPAAAAKAMANGRCGKVEAASLRDDQGARRRFLRRLDSARGAAFAAAVVVDSARRAPRGSEAASPRPRPPPPAFAAALPWLRVHGGAAPPTACASSGGATDGAHDQRLSGNGLARSASSLDGGHAEGGGGADGVPSREGPKGLGDNSLHIGHTPDGRRRRPGLPWRSRRWRSSSWWGASHRERAAQYVRVLHERRHSLAEIVTCGHRPRSITLVVLRRSGRRCGRARLGLRGRSDEGELTLGSRATLHVPLSAFTGHSHRSAFRPVRTALLLVLSKARLDACRRRRCSRWRVVWRGRPADRRHHTAVVAVGAPRAGSATAVAPRAPRAHDAAARNSGRPQPRRAGRPRRQARRAFPLNCRDGRQRRARSRA